MVGDLDGLREGPRVGDREGDRDGLVEGVNVGEVGDREGVFEGNEVGPLVGNRVGSGVVGELCKIINSSKSNDRMNQINILRIKN